MPIHTTSHILYAAVLETRGYIVGEANAANGLHRYDGERRWTSLGWSNLRHSGIAVEPGRAGTMYLAAGNGVLRSTDGGGAWRVTTDWRITEVQDVAVDPHTPERVYAGTAYGVIRTDDRGETWVESSSGIPAPSATFIQSICTDRGRHGRVIAGSEEGLFLSEDGADTWHPAGPRGVAIRSVRQSAADPHVLLAGTEDQGVLISRDRGATWRFAGGDIARETCYSVAIDPSEPARMAAAGYDTGVFLSEDGGVTWDPWAADLPERTVHALAFDPDEPGCLWVGAVGRGVFRAAPDACWQHLGLENATIRDMLFVRRN